ncbi:MAG TPA: DNA-binding protein [Planctomycetaceae bacterium]|nr:DNA-binding protein [Planctomycetaceae bacterium]
MFATSTGHSEQSLICSQEAAQFLSISERTLWTLTHAGEVPHIRIGRSVRYRLSALNSWLDSKTKGGVNHE